MRALILCLLAACTPEIVSGAYLCGPDALCPDGQVCNGTEDDDAGLVADTCVLASLARPFECSPEVNAEPDDTMAEAYAIPLMTCVAAPFTIDNCIAAADTADWVTFVAPMCTGGRAVHARLTFPFAYQTLAIELWDVDANLKVADETDCVQGGGADAVRRCLDLTLTAGKAYAVKVVPTGEGDCAGDCAYNRYSLNVQLGPPG
jgi:hypothetical protein